MFINDKLSADAVHGQEATQRTGFAHEHGTLLPQPAVNNLHDTGLPAAFYTERVLGSGNTPR
ncbi:hypothetical protein HER32_05845 [Hymenobacter sp. BT18]|uniref:hypothetical protein n=1 Tax=Hymenobacter sp. BT18 TaxID=2835648 RepID=UPI00143E1608|nr:hypothetical protein [Hymenobacter sp. BT18]QIX60720.1 hypothetical protein HER32_05845 [Hymenobacter sp. BT18]